MTTRRNFLKTSAGIAASISVSGLAGCSGTSGKQPVEVSKDVKWPVIEGPNTPKLCISCGRGEQSMRDAKQMGVDNILFTYPQIPWTVEDLQSIMDQYKAYGLTVCNIMIAGLENVIYAKPGRDETIEMVKQSIVAAGVVGLPVIEWNFYTDRLTEGYYYKEGRGGSGISAFDYAPVKDLPPRPGIDKYSADQLWDNATYFLNAVIPVAEKAGVRMALHPNDPPPAISKGNPQIIATFDNWRRLLDIAKTPFHGMTFDPGVSYEMGLDPIEVMRMMGNQMNHAHYRNVITHEPYHKYEEVFFDVGQVNMFAVMQEHFKMGYNLYIFPEHPRFFSRDGEPGKPQRTGGTTGQIYNVAYARAMMQAVMSI